eukprot:3055407-Rhodomonas_salina.3
MQRGRVYGRQAPLAAYACYAMSGNDIALAMRCPVLTHRLLCDVRHYRNTYWLMSNSDRANVDRSWSERRV